MYQAKQTHAYEANHENTQNMSLSNETTNKTKQSKLLST